MAKKSNQKNLRLFLLGGGMFMLLCGWSMYSQGHKSASEIDNWTQVEAVILRAEVKTVTMNNTYSRGPSFVTGYEPAISYRYSFEGRTFKGSRFTIAPSASQEREPIASIVAAHPTGSEATAWVNPENPSEAVLSRSDQGESTALAFVGIFLAVIGLGGIGAAAMLHRRPEQPEPCRMPADYQAPVSRHEV